VEASYGAPEQREDPRARGRGVRTNGDGYRGRDDAPVTVAARTGRAPLCHARDKWTTTLSASHP